MLNVKIKKKEIPVKNENNPRRNWNVLKIENVINFIAFSSCSYILDGMQKMDAKNGHEFI